MHHQPGQPEDPQRPLVPPSAYQSPPREPYAVRHERHMQERFEAEQARRAARGQRPLPPGQQRTSHAGTCAIFGTLAVLAGAIGPRIPGYLTSQSGARYSVASYHALCSSSLGELAQAGHGSVASDCSKAALLLTAGWVVVGLGGLLLLAAVLLWTRQQPSGTYPVPPQPPSS